MPSKTPHPQREIFVLHLTDGGAPDIPGGYIYLPPPSEPPYSIRFTIEGTSSICRQGSLWVNLPAEGDAFDRSKFREFKLEPDFNRALEIDVPVTQAGAFAFYTTYTPLPEFSPSSTTTPEPTQTETFYIDVSPKLTLGGDALPLDALSIVSVVSKFMGRYPQDWERHLKGLSQRGYNMVHFTPLQKRGESNSPYSIYDQLLLDTEIFPDGENDIAAMIKKMETEHKMLGLTDVVFNHTANNSKWLEEHPEAGYSVETAPWLQSALELDNALLKFGDDLEKHGLPTEFKTIDDLTKVVQAMKDIVISGIRLWEFYAIDTERDVEAVLQAYKAGHSKIPPGGFEDSAVGGLDIVKQWSLKQRADFLKEKGMMNGLRIDDRWSRQVKPGVGAALLTAIHGRFTNANEARAMDTIKNVLDELNLPFYREYDEDVAEIMQQVFDRVKYLRLDEHGPKLGSVTKKDPFIETYFSRLPDNEVTKKHSPKALALVCNGWIWAADAMKDNAGPDWRPYLRREVIVWSDCVKLRYGKGPDDNPFLWDFMSRYTRLMAKYFAGFRIDNCHSTPIHVAEHLLDQARLVRPNLAVFAELFTGSEETDYVFVKKLGLSALIREAMQAWSTQELSRLVHRHGGRPIGSFAIDVPVNISQQSNGTHSLDRIRPESRETVRHIRESPVHALFMDCTHDNEMPAQKRDARDTLPNAALVNMCACATGSVMGYDEVYPRLVEIVSEKRHYSSPYSESQVKEGASIGIGGVKKILNQIHSMMGKDGYDETHIHHEGEYITVHRVHPESRKGYFLIARTVFPGSSSNNGRLSPVHLAGTQAEELGSWTLEVDASTGAKTKIAAEEKLLKGLPSSTKDLGGVTVVSDGNDTTITIPENFPPGSIALFKTRIPEAEHSEGLGNFITSEAHEAFEGLDLIDLNVVLFRCDAEERDSSGGRDGVYNIPDHGPLVYAGLQGWWSVLENIVKYNDLGHPLCNHLRDGPWALDFIVERMEKLRKESGYTRLHKPAQWIKERFDAVRALPNFLLPRYFAIIVQVAYSVAQTRILSNLAPSIRRGQSFLQSLAMVSVQQTGYVKSASLWPSKEVASLAAGLPHFAVDWARCWGRDVFISLRGLFLCTGRFTEAKEHIIAFGSVLKHGMIPNLLSSGKLPRYNSRDSPWFFLQNIQDYTKIAPDGLNILQSKVPRRFLPYDDTWFPHDDPRAYSQSTTIEEVIQEVFQRHASGLSFREYNAGPELDMQMKPEGFQIDVHVDWGTGIIFGGSQHNCGTWMDKMGESDKAGSKGVPGTPRDGAAVEITGLLYSALKWVAELYEQGKYRFDGVQTAKQQHVPFAVWAAKIKAHFEKAYWIPAGHEEDGQFDIDSKLINRRGIYKDLYRSGQPYEDYQLRPNFPIAMTVAPDLFTPHRALIALANADEILRGPTGMATLDPSDLNYRPYYNNSEDSTDFATSKGRNYHQGPEWLWPTGFFLRALLTFDLMRRKTSEERLESFQQVTRRLLGCKQAIQDSPWRGLTELTNKKGEYCADSSPTQAWSAGCLIDLFHDASTLARE